MRLVLAGDVMLGRLVNRALRLRSPASPWGDTLPIIRGADWSFCNLECVISDLLPAALPGKAFHFRSDRKNVAVLREAGIDAVSVANNHSLDFGPAALLDMLATLDREGIGHAGAGTDLEAAMRPALSTVGRLRIAVLACTDNEPGWAAGEGRPGVWFVPTEPGDRRARALLEQVRRVSAAADLVVVSLHWGSNWGREPEPGHRDLAHSLVEAGAGIVFGHSCHVFRGVEGSSGAVTIYSAGNFVDDYAVDEVERNDQSFTFEIDVDRGRVARVRMRPTVIRDMQARLARGDEAAAILEEMKLLSERLGSRVAIRGGEACLELPG